jgi:molecular chaperone DnaJ
MQGTTVEVDVLVTAQEARAGTQKEVRYPRMIPCPECGGWGKVGNLCPECNGTGQIKKVKRTTFGIMEQMVICPKCKKKREYPEHPCQRCEGKGIMLERKTIVVNVPPGVYDGMYLKCAGGGNCSTKGGILGDLILNIHLT